MAYVSEKSSNGDSSGPIQDRLLDAAEELFCEKGFAGSSIRDITAAADCNIAAVNYHFSGKDNLYVEVWRRLLIRMREARIEAVGRVMAGDNPSLEDVVRAFAESFFGPSGDESTPPRLMKLMAGEMLDHHVPVNMFIEELLVPTITVVSEALCTISPRLDKSKLSLIVFSIAAQMVHVAHSSLFDCRDNPEMPMCNLAELMDHIIKFSVEGIRGYVEGDTK